jgi:hypothetical protein
MVASVDASNGGSNASTDGSVVSMDLDGSVGDGAAALPRPDYRSGTRLRAMIYKTSDGDKLWHHWYDSQLKIPCAMQLGADGQMRCLPNEYASQFSDDQCKTPVLAVGPTCATPAYAIQTNDCDGATLYKVGDKTTPARIYLRSGTTCMDAGAPGEGSLYALTPLPASTAVAAKEVHDARGSDLMETYLEAEDGALQPVSAYDPARKSDCAPGAVADRCTPSNVAYVSSAVQYWADMGCSTSRLAARFGCASKMPVAVGLLLTSTDACGNVTANYSFAEIGAETAAASFVSNGGQACQTNTLKSPNPRLYPVGAAIAPTTMPKMGNLDVGAGRVKVRYQVDGAGNKIHAASLYDSTRKEICQATPTSSGLRCIPTADQASSFSDDKCDRPLIFANKPLASCPPRMPPAFVRSGGWTTCSNQITPVRYFAVGAKLDHAMVYYGGGTNCDAANGVSGVDFYDSTEIPVTDFGSLEDVTE